MRDLMHYGILCHSATLKTLIHRHVTAFPLGNAQINLLLLLTYSYLYDYVV